MSDMDSSIKLSAVASLLEEFGKPQRATGAVPRDGTLVLSCLFQGLLHLSGFQGGARWDKHLQSLGCGTGGTIRCRDCP